MLDDTPLKRMPIGWDINGKQREAMWRQGDVADWRRPGKIN